MEAREFARIVEKPFHQCRPSTLHETGSQSCYGCAANVQFVCIVGFDSDLLKSKIKNFF